MNDSTLTLMLAWLSGCVFGAIFFGGLWWTARKCLSLEQPAPWFLGSLLLRMSMALAGFYFVCGGQWQRLLLCLMGFVMARVAVTVLIRPSGAGRTFASQEVGHAPWSR